MMVLYIDTICEKTAFFAKGSQEFIAIDLDSLDVWDEVDVTDPYMVVRYWSEASGCEPSSFWFSENVLV